MTQLRDDLLTPADAAKVLGLTPAAIVAMASRGVLPAILTAGGRRLFWRRDVERVAAARAERLRAGEDAQ
jgi:excisionase family DNA binding protein